MASTDNNQPKYLEVINNLFAAKQAWKYSALMLSGVVAFLAYALVYQARNTPVALVPYELAATQTRVKVSGNNEIRGTSAEYMANLAMGDLAQILNFTPENVLTQHQRFLNRVTDELYASQKDKLTADATDLRKRGITQSFYPMEVKVSSDSSKVEVSGTQVRWSGSTELMRTSMTYYLTYKVKNQYMQVSDLRQEQTDAKK